MALAALGAAISPYLLPIMIIGASTSGGFSGAAQGAQAKEQICNLNQTLKDYVKNSQKELDLYTLEYGQLQTQIQNQRRNIGYVQRNAKIAKENYKNSTTFFKVFGISLAVILIFILVTKKIILRETALPGK